MSISSLFEFGTWLGQEDVNGNLGSSVVPRTCDVCDKQGANLYQCNGTFPMCCVQGFTFDGKGQEFGCQRGVVCESCFKIKSITRTRNNSYWYCSACTTDTGVTYEDCWGYRVIGPSTNALVVAPGESVRAHSRITDGFMQPADTRRRREVEKRVSLSTAADTAARSGGLKSVEAVGRLLGAMRDGNMSMDAMTKVLGALNVNHDRGCTQGPIERPDVCPYPRTVDTFIRRGEAVVPSDEHVDNTTVHTDARDLGQLQESVVTTIGHLPDLVQSIIDDPRNPREHFYWGAQSREYFDETGARAVGPETWQGGSRRGEVYGTVPRGVTGILLIAWSDGVRAQSGDVHPHQISIANQSIVSRLTASGSRLLATLGGPSVRSNDKLNDSQRRSKNQIIADQPAHALALADECARTCIVHTINGEEKQCTYRLLIYAMDKAEEYGVLALRKNNCPRCLAWRSAVDAEAKEGRGSAATMRPHLRTDHASLCSTAERRTPAFVARTQARLARLNRQHGQAGATEKEAVLNGVYFDVDAQLNRLSALIPHETGGIYASVPTDMLHVWSLGVVQKYLTALDLALFKFGQVGGRSREDIRHEVETFLAALPGMASPYHRETHFGRGWWSRETTMLKGDDWIAYFSQIIFLFIGNDTLIPDGAVRDRLVRFHQLLFRIYRRISVPRWILETDLSRLESDLKASAVEMTWMQDLLGDEWEGDGFNAPKVHDFFNFARTISEIGAALNGSTGAFEMTNKALKAADRATGRSTADGDHGTALLVRAGRLEAQRSARKDDEDQGAEEPSEPKVRRLESAGQLTGAVGDKRIWQRVTSSLIDGKQGPALPLAVVCTLEARLRALLLKPDPAEVPIFGRLLLVREGKPNCIVQPGQCFRMFDGNYCQLLVSVSNAEGAIMCMMSPFEAVPYAPVSGCYMGFRWLQRCDHFSLKSVTQIERREHLIPFEGRAPRQEGDQHQQYLVNSGRFYEEDKDTALQIFCGCPVRGCSGRAPRPSAGIGKETNCLTCGDVFPWY